MANLLTVGCVALVIVLSTSTVSGLMDELDKFKLQIAVDELEETCEKVTRRAESVLSNVALNTRQILQGVQAVNTIAPYGRHYAQLAEDVERLSRRTMFLQMQGTRSALAKAVACLDALKSRVGRSFVEHLREPESDARELPSTEGEIPEEFTLPQMPLSWEKDYRRAAHVLTKRSAGVKESDEGDEEESVW